MPKNRQELTEIQTLEDWIHVWITEVLPNVVKDNTRIMYKETMERHVLPSLGRKKLAELSESVIQQWILQIQQAQIPGTMQGHMTEGTVRNTLSVLSGCLRDAQKYGLIEENPCLRPAWKMPGKNLWESHEWLSEEQISILEPLIVQYQDENDYPVGVGFQLILYAGLTLSEVSALRWKDVDLEQKTITVRYFVVAKRGQEFPKEELSLEEVPGRRRREVPLPDFLAQRLSEILDAYSCGEEDFVIASPQKKPVSMERLRAVLFRRSQKAGLEKVTPRMLRDTYAIHAVQAGATSDMIAELMGFASAQQVVRRYMPRTSTDKRVLVNRMYKC